MPQRIFSVGSGVPLVLVSVTLAGLLGCAGAILSQPGPRFLYFASPAPDDLWSGKIAGWQRRELADQSTVMRALPAVAQAALGGEGDGARAAQSIEPTPTSDTLTTEAAPVDLRAKYRAFRAERRRATAREFADWVQRQAKQHYVADGPIDHWATLEETLRSDGDDCDGLELLVFHGLRDLGFDDSEVFRSIVFRPSDGQHHMVTLWFENPDDPWVLDPTGAMTTGMPRMSDLPAWVPLKVFSDTEEYTVRRGPPVPARTALAANP